MRRSIRQSAWIFLALMVMSTGVLFAEGQSEVMASTYQTEMGQQVEESPAAESEETLPYGYGYGYHGPMGMMGRGWDQQRFQFIEEEGILISDVLVDSPASQAGLQRGDSILTIDSKAVNTIAELNAVLLEYEHGQPVVLQVKRGDEVMEVALRLESRVGRPLLGIASDRTFGMSPQNSWNGPMGRSYGGQSFGGRQPFAGPQAREPFSRMFPQNQERMPLFDAAVVVEVVAESPAELAGLQAGSLIVAVDGDALVEGDLVSAITKHAAGDTVTLTFANGETLDVTLGDADGKAYLGVMYHTMGSRWEDLTERSAPGPRMELPGASDL